MRMRVRTDTMRDITAPLALVMVISVVGCTGTMGLGGGQNNHSPPGLSPDQGITDADALVDAHTENLQNSSYTVNYTLTTQYANGTLRTTRRTTTMVGVPQERYQSISRIAGSVNGVLGANNGTVKYWSNGTTTVRAVLVGNESTSRELSDAPSGVRKSYSERLYVLLSSSNFSVTKETAEGETRYRVRSTDIVQPDIIPRSNDVTNITNVSLAAAVSAAGTVQSYNLSYEATIRGERIQVEERLRFTEINSTMVEKPSWVETQQNYSTSTP